MTDNKNVKKVLGILVLFVLAAASLSCRLPLVGSGDPVPGPSTPEQAAVGTTTEPASSSRTSSADADTGTAQGEQRPPASFKVLLERGIKEGRWTRGEGLHYLLQVFQNEKELETKVSHQEWSMVYYLAADYVKAEGDPELREKIEDQLQQIAAPLENLSLYSEPAEGQQSSRGYKMSRPNLQVDCADLFKKGFPETRAATCLLYQEIETPYVKFQIYYPEPWAGDEEYENILEGVKKAAMNSAETYANYGSNENMLIIFSPTHTESRPDPKKRTKGVSLPPSYRSGDACPIIIFNNPEYLLGEDAKEIIAHEIFHCFQMKNFFSGDEINYPENSWWMEGTAVHFSNVAFPDIKYDYKFVQYFDRNSQDKQLKDMEYGNYTFFTDWMNHKGNQNLIGFMDWISELESAQSQMGELAIYEDMDVYFHRFGQRYLDQNIPDPGGDNLPIPADTNREIDINSTGEAFNVTVKPFQLYRMDALYIPQRRFFQSGELDYRVNTTIRRDGEPDTWKNVPDKLYSRCTEKDPYLFLITSSDVEKEGTSSMNIDKIEKAACDGCLLGDWQVENESFINWFNALAEQNKSSGTKLEEMSGLMGVRFGEDRTFRSINKELSIVLTVSGVDTGGVTFNITSLGNGNWQTNQAMNQLSYSERDLKADVTATVPGVGNLNFGGGSIPEDMLPPGVEDFGFEGDIDSINAMGTFSTETNAQALGYTCGEETLTFHYPQLSDIVLDRLDEPIPLPTFEGGDDSNGS
ncbi:MAG: hypothetical protein KGY46_11130 [Anaerolineales bacterium]|nr:hypothetical protein [Anaerolineales bacterium]